ncbi:MAG: zinc metallopeptidase [Gammaproteobacteria bacterium]|nr:zinc metallopeptidase [Gammaproteobacteria bacterium]
MIYLPVIIVLLLLLYGPQFWAHAIFSRYSRERRDLEGSGGELAQHLAKKFDLDIGVEITREGDHYDPLTRTVRLQAGNFHGRHLTALAIAAHEIGHAIQHARGERALLLRTQLAHVANSIERFGALLLIAAPLLIGISHAPITGLIPFLGGLFVLSLAALIHLVTLPVEWDASFHKAWPILVEGGYIGVADRKAVRTILRAAALTYVAASLAALLNLWRWLRLLKR